MTIGKIINIGIIGIGTIGKRHLMAINQVKDINIVGVVDITEAAQKLELSEITENSVKFEDVSGFGMPTLGYSNPDADTFIVHVGQEGGNTFDIELKARSIW